MREMASGRLIPWFTARTDVIVYLRLMAPLTLSPRQMALRSYLVVLIIGSMLPFLVVSGALLLRILRDDRASVERTLITSARQQAAALDAETDATIRTLQALGASAFLERDDLEAFEPEARRVLARKRGARCACCRRNRARWLTLRSHPANR